MLKSRLAILLVASVLQAVFWLAVLRADPFGMSSAADRVSEGIFLRLYPILYPGAARDKIQVVMIDEGQLPLPIEGASSEWPIRFEDHVALIERILSFEPKAVFVDFLFDTEKGREPQVFADFVARLQKSSSAPVVFASYRDPLAQARVIEPLRALAPDSGAVREGFVELTAPANHYQLSDGQGRLSAAAVLYNAASGAADAGKISADRAGDMLVAWGNTVTPADAAFSDCAPIVDKPSSRLEGLTAAVLAGLSGALDAEAVRQPKGWERLQPCPYHGETGARDVFSETPEKLSKRFKGAYVLLGAAISASGDTVVSPVHGQLPGVYLHAMALDNLITFNGRPLQSSIWAGFVQASLIFLCAFAGGYFFAERPVPATRGEAVTVLGVRSVVWAGFAAVAVSLLLLLLLQFNLAPYNWGSVLAVAGVVFFAGAGKAVLTLVRGE